MRKLLLNSTALATVAALTSGVALADVSISAAHEWKYTSTASTIAAQDGTEFSNVSEIKFAFSNKTDSGLTIGYTVELDSDATTAAAVAIDERSLSIAGGFGKVVLGQNDGVGDNYGLGALDLIGEEPSELVGSASISKDADIVMYSGDDSKIAYHLPPMGNLTVGGSYTNSGTAVTSTDTTEYGFRYVMPLDGMDVTIGGATGTQEAATKDSTSNNIGVKVVRGNMTFSVSQSTDVRNGEDIDAQAMAATMLLANGMTVGVYSFSAEDTIDKGEKYDTAGVEVKYVIAPGLNAILNVTDYTYKQATSGSLTASADNGTTSQLTIQASF